MQASLFKEVPLRTGETVEAIETELMEKARVLYPKEFFVFGIGPHDADVVVVGESPGPPDRLTGRPFSGPSGDLLFKILASIGLNPEACYLTNVVKFISTGDDITAEVIAFFTPYLSREILAINPSVVISLGNTPTRALFNTKQPISKMRGEVGDLGGIPIIPTFNPAYLLRDPTKKREVWEDMKKVQDVLQKK